jgi:hypothetical protein
MSKRQENAYFKDLQRRIRKIYRPDGTRGRSRISFGEGIKRLIDKHKTRREPVPFDIQVWLIFFDEVIAFWLVIWAFYRERFEDEPRPPSKLSICLMTLAGRAFQDMVCVRNLVESGFFVQSNVVTRSLIEAIDIMHILNMNPGVADEFCEVKTNDEATRFWHKYCSKNKIHKQIKERWSWFLEGQEDAVSSFHSMRLDYLDLIGMSSHPSFPSSYVTFMDKPKGRKFDSIARNALGGVSHMSKFTIHLILLRVFEYGILWSGPKASLYKGDGPAPPRSGLHENIQRGLSAVFSIVTTVDIEGPNEIYPEFQTHWPIHRS